MATKVVAPKSEEKLVFDVNELTVGDLEDFEDIVGLALDKALMPKKVYDEDNVLVTDDKGRPVKEVQLSTKALKALVFLIRRQDNPDFSIEDARNVKVSELNLGGTSDADSAELEKNAPSD